MRNILKVKGLALKNNDFLNTNDKKKKNHRKYNGGRYQKQNFTIINTNNKI